MSNEEVAQEAGTAAEEVAEAATVLQVDTNTAINAPLDEVEDPETLKKIVKKLRAENAKSRTEKNAQKDELAEFRAWKESQMTELERAQAKIADLEKEAATAVRTAILAKHGISEDDDLAVFITGTREEMEEKAGVLAARLERKNDGLVPEVFKNQSGAAPVKPKKEDGATFLEMLAQNGRI